MRQVWIPRVGAPEVLEVREAPDPTPGPGEVRVAVEAAGVNFADIMARRGLYRDAPPLPAVVGYEVAGTIDAVGAGVSQDRLGEPVVAMTRFGGYSSAVVVPAVQVARRPEGFDAVRAASLPVAGATAWMMVEIMGRVRAGDRVLVHSAGGAVGMAALDLCKRHGAWVAGTASAGKHEALRAWGYDRLVDYTTEDFEVALADVGGFDLVLDAVGGSSWGRSLRLLRAGGRLCCFGLSESTQGRFGMLGAALRIPWLAMSAPSLIDHNRGVLGVNMGHLWHEAERVTGWLHEVLACASDGSVRTHVHATVPFDRAAEAHAMLEGRKNLGKVVLTP